MVTVVRTNLVTDSRATTAGRWVGPASATETMVTGATDGPTLPDGTKATTYARYTMTANVSTGFAYFGYSHPESGAAPQVAPAGTSFGFGLYMRVSRVPTAPLRLYARPDRPDGSQGVDNLITNGANNLVAGQWAYAGWVNTVADAVARMEILQVGWAPGTSPLLIGDVIEVTAGIAEPGATSVAPFFDGSTPDGPIRADGSRFVYDWTGTANASTSTESLTTPVIAASLITSAGSPPPVQIVLNGIPNGAEYVVTGTTGDGSSWPVPGGTGVSTGDQMVLIDNRSALNTPVVYQVVTGGVTYAAAEVSVDFAGQFVLQSLDGQTVVEFVWDDNGLPRDFVVNSAAFPVSGRERPPGRFAPGGDGGGSLVIRTTMAFTAAVQAILRGGKPVVLRTDGTVRDLPAVDLLQITGASNRLWGGENGISTQRVWALDYLLMDDPEPNTVLSAWTWDDFDEAMETRTWDDFDALFASSTWDEFDTYPWGQL